MNLQDRYLINYCFSFAYKEEYDLVSTKLMISRLDDILDEDVTLEGALIRLIWIYHGYKDVSSTAINLISDRVKKIDPYNLKKLNVLYNDFLFIFEPISGENTATIAYLMYPLWYKCVMKITERGFPLDETFRPPATLK